MYKYNHTCVLFRDFCSTDKENVAEGGTGTRADGMLVDSPLHGQQSAPLPTVFVETDTTVRNRETIDSFLEIVTDKALQHMNDPSVLAAAIAIRRKLENATTAKQVADVFFQGGTLKRFKSGVAIRVQPTSIARRRLALTRGTKKMPVGRLAKVKLNKTNGASICKRSRPHSLLQNIRANVPNAKK